MIADVLFWVRSNKALAGFVLIAASILAACVAWLIAVGVGEHRERGRQSEAKVVAVTIDNAAKETLDIQRRDSDRLNAARQAELEKADDNEADNRPSPARIAYLCRVRAQGPAGLSKLPAACRPAGGG